MIFSCWNFDNQSTSDKRYKEIYNQCNRGIDFNVKTEYRNGSKYIC